MARNQGFNLLTAGLGVGMLFTGGIRGWNNMQQAEELRGRESNIAETVVHWVGDQKHVIGEVVSNNDGAPTPVDGVLFITDLELAIGIAGAVTAAKSVKSLSK